MHCKSYSHFCSKTFQHICVSLDVNFNESLINDVVSFEQLGPGHFFTILMCRNPNKKSHKLSYLYKMAEIYPLTSSVVANSVYPDQRLHSAMSDLGRNVLTISRILDLNDINWLILRHLNSSVTNRITKTRLFKYIENFTIKNGTFSDKKF